MDTIMKIALLAVVGALIGYTTNVVAIKLLFRPLLPVNILGFKYKELFLKEEMK